MLCDVMLLWQRGVRLHTNKSYETGEQRDNRSTTAHVTKPTKHKHNYRTNNDRATNSRQQNKDRIIKLQRNNGQRSFQRRHDNEIIANITKIQNYDKTTKLWKTRVNQHIPTGRMWSSNSREIADKHAKKTPPKQHYITKHTTHQSFVDLRSTDSEHEGGGCGERRREHRIVAEQVGAAVCTRIACKRE